MKNQFESKQYLRIALEMIGKHGLSPDPVNYHVWYAYAVGDNETLKRDIDRHVEERGLLSDDVILQMFNQHIATKEQNITSLVSKQLKAVLAEIVSAIASADHQFDGASQNLNAIHAYIDQNLSETELGTIIKDIKAEIGLLKSANGAFQAQLKQADQKITDLNRKLSRYHEQAHKDPLTQVDNRRAFEKKLLEVIVGSNTTETAVCLILADIDHFKRVNDTHGHLVGDNVLKMVAATIKESVKGRDTVARFGGEEFAILLADTPIEGAAKLANDMRLAFELMDFKKRNTGEKIDKITLSFGVTQYRRGEDAMDFINRADKALYRSKNTGRNKVTVG
ncbi:putative Signal transduction family protein (GGDEF domain protein) [Desulfosarcina cetonica]|uniref:GGDEF domain-containing protein n=1 Tax=Desulfosarcina cetonica TaxID=90730 RepID=UPI0006D021BA|nr:GGDEF domain-containing protein [Desulfosarcina cetonica]VTR65432.1 putative Signal transduction family protein (GGDEF domain protein) [Desulfosarcina cetonica]